MQKVFIKCDTCGYVHDAKRLKKDFYICSSCGFHNKMPYQDRINLIADSGSFQEINGKLPYNDPLQFPGYAEKYNQAVIDSGLNEAVVTGSAKLKGNDIMLGVMDSRFMMGSMGVLVGYKIASLFEAALEKSLPVILFSASGGARMQEGLYALMQMARTAAAVQEFHEAGGYYISVLTNPTTGGVSASFAFLGDTMLAEPKALIGFAGPRVIRQTIREELPKGFQTAEYLLQHGFIDAIVKREDLRSKLGWLIEFHQSPQIQNQ